MCVGVEKRDTGEVQAHFYTTAQQAKRGSGKGRMALKKSNTEFELKKETPKKKDQSETDEGLWTRRGRKGEDRTARDEIKEEAKKNKRNKS